MLWAVLFCSVCTLYFAGPFGSKALSEERPGDAVFEPLRREYLKLRNTDSNLEDTAAWEIAARRLEAFAERFPDNSNSPQALFNASIAWEELYKKGAAGASLRDAMACLNRLIEKYGESSYADDALVRKGDLLRVYFGRLDEAEYAYRWVVARYPKSDMYEAARLRLGLSSGAEGERWERASAKAATGEKLVVLDAGHGGEDFGACGVGGLLEKDVSLAVALDLKNLLEAQKIARVELTRSADDFIPLERRVETANRLGADLFVSLHTNASVDGKLSGLQVFYFDEASDEASSKLAARENQASPEGAMNGELQAILQDMMLDAKRGKSALLANAVHRSSVARLKGKWNSIRDLGVRKAPFFVLAGVNMPSILVEMFFVDNSDEGALLAKKEFRHELALGMLDGIAGFLDLDSSIGLVEKEQRVPWKQEPRFPRIKLN